jgi:hypothetical protein
MGGGEAAPAAKFEWSEIWDSFYDSFFSRTSDIHKMILFNLYTVLH